MHLRHLIAALLLSCGLAATEASSSSAEERERPATGRETRPAAKKPGIKAKRVKAKRTARKRSKPAPSFHLDENDLLRLRHLIRAMTALALFLLYTRWLRADLAADGQVDGFVSVSTPNRGVFAGGPKALRIKPGEPQFGATYEITGVFSSRAKRLAAMPAAEAPTPEASAMLGADTGQMPQLDLSTGQPAKLEMQKTPASGPKRDDIAAKGGTALPPSLRTHFTEIPGETLHWHGAFTALGYADGAIGISNARVMGVVRRTVITVFPPKVETTLRRHQHALSALTMYKVDKTRQPRFLGLGAIFCLWFPYGTTFGVAMILAFFIAQRPMLTVWFGDQKRRYPLQGPALAEAQRALASASGKRALGQGGGPGALKKGA